jgi:hypothetical protein
MDSLTLDVECTATVSVPNTDVMFVLDVTGSMSSTPSGDTMSKLAGLKVATKDFFTELGAGTGIWRGAHPLWLCPLFGHGQCWRHPEKHGRQLHAGHDARRCGQLSDADTGDRP